MKINIEIDCSPEEARRFLGFPDLTPVHQAMVAQMTESMAKAKPYFDPETMTKMLFPMGTEALEGFQKAMWAAATGAQDTPGGKSK